MEKITTIGVDIAKHLFQVHGINAAGAIVTRRKLRRDDVVGFFEALPPCLIGIEACATGHHWARVLMALGHEVRLMPSSYVKPYVKRQKNDATDAEAICEAVTRPTMRFVPVKSEEQQSVLMQHRVRELLIRQRTMLVNALRGHLAEFGIVTRQGIAGVGMLITLIEDGDPDPIPPLARSALLPLIQQLREVHEKVCEMDRQIHAWHRSNELSRRLETIPRNRPDHCQRTHRDSDRRIALQIRPTTGGVDRPGAAAELIGWQGPPRKDQQTRRSLSPPASRCRSTRSASFQPQGQSCTYAMGRRASGEEAVQRRRCCLGEQDGTDRLGANDDGQAL